MGILGLWNALKDFPPKKIPLRRPARILVDGTWLGYKLVLPIKDLKPSDFTVVLKKNFENKMKMLQGYDPDEIIFVFDPILRSPEKIRRKDRESTRIPDNEYKEYISLVTKVFKVIQAPVETDLTIRDMITKDDLAYTDDSDFFLFSPGIIRFDGDIYMTKEVIAFSELTPEEFRDACSIAANDYNYSSMTFAAARKKILNKD